MQARCFITGTDTDAGKTVVAEAILSAFASKGMKTLGYKPVAAGCEQTSEGLRNDDALKLQAASSIAVPYEQVNPLAYRDPVAPHLAAQRENRPISLRTLLEGFEALRQYKPDLLLMEGAGGWQLPLGNGAFMPDAVKALELPVILVVGMKLGCLNHALLTVAAVRAAGLQLVGWVANQVDPDMDYQSDNLATLKELIDAPCLGYVPHLQGGQRASDALDMAALSLALNLG